LNEKQRVAMNGLGAGKEGWGRRVQRRCARPPAFKWGPSGETYTGPHRRLRLEAANPENKSPGELVLALLKVRDDKRYDNMEQTRGSLEEV